MRGDINRHVFNFSFAALELRLTTLGTDVRYLSSYVQLVRERRKKKRTRFRLNSRAGGAKGPPRSSPRGCPVHPVVHASHLVDHRSHVVGKNLVVQRAQTVSLPMRRDDAATNAAHVAAASSVIAAVTAAAAAAATVITAAAAAAAAAAYAPRMKRPPRDFVLNDTRRLLWSGPFTHTTHTLSCYRSTGEALH